MKSVYSLAAALLAAGPAGAATQTLDITLDAGQHDRANTPVQVPLRLRPALAQARSVVLKGPQGETIPAQLTQPGLSASRTAAPAGTTMMELHFILAEMKAGKTVRLKATVSTDAPRETTGFTWKDTPREHTDLLFGERPVLRYMYRPLDESSKEARELSYKVFHHLYDPAGKRIVTKGAGGQFTHHRGLFFGFNKVSYSGKTADVWHATGDAHQSHQQVLEQVAGPVLARQRVLVHWHGPAKEVFAREQREVTVYNVPGGQLVEFASRVESSVGKVRLDGDPQHAGFHFRADNEVAEKTKAHTYYLRPDGAGKPGETRNWPGNREHVNLPWNGMSFVLGDQRYTALYLDHPTNPKEARFSERDYGRFGSYFEYDLDQDKPLNVRYRVWLQEGELTGPRAAAASMHFVEPVQATVKAQ